MATVILGPGMASLLMWASCSYYIHMMKLGWWRVAPSPSDSNIITAPLSHAGSRGTIADVLRWDPNPDSVAISGPANTHPGRRDYP